MAKVSLSQSIIKWALHREPDAVIGGRDNPYLLRWFLIPRNRFFNIYVHWFLRSDDDRALHDHPWINCSVILEGQYLEHTIKQGGIHARAIRRAGEWHVRWTGKIAHRVELINGPCWTLFITGPKYREWGFHCVERGWVHWKLFTADDDPGSIGKGCEA